MKVVKKMAKVQIKGVIVPNGLKWIYEWFEMDATSPNDVTKQITDANGEDLEVEINSGGGDVYAGSEIYTVLKDYKGNVVVKIVGIAASAASVIAMAGNKVMISPPAQIMIHNVSSAVRGDYRELEHKAAFLKNYNVSIANAYMLKTGIRQDELLKLMNKETWLNAQQALEYGFADEIMFDDNNQLVASINSFVLPPEVINKMRNLIKNQEFKNTGQQAGLNFTQSTQLPLQEPAPKPQLVNISREDEPLEIKNTDELRQHFPDLVAQVEAAAKEGATKAERLRIQAIDEISKTVSPELVNKAKYEEPMTAQDLAFNALKADAGKGRQYLESAALDNAESGAAKVTGQPQGQLTGQEKDAEERKNNAQGIADYANKRRAN